MSSSIILGDPQSKKALLKLICMMIHLCCIKSVFGRLRLVKLVIDCQLNNLLVSTMFDVRYVMVDWMCRCQSGCSVEGNDTCDSHVEDVWCWSSVVQSHVASVVNKVMTCWDNLLIGYYKPDVSFGPCLELCGPESFILDLWSSWSPVIQGTIRSTNCQINQPSDYMYSSVTLLIIKLESFCLHSSFYSCL